MTPDADEEMVTAAPAEALPVQEDEEQDDDSGAHESGTFRRRPVDGTAAAPRRPRATPHLLWAGPTEWSRCR